METEELKEKTKDIGSHAGDYIDTLYKLVMVTITQKTTNIASRIIVVITVSIFTVFVVFFASFGLALWLSDLVKSRAGGFIIVSGFYLLLILCIIISRKKIFSSIRNLIIGKLYE